MGYQSFNESKGDSDSLGKLAAIQLPEDLTGLKVLDLGCNEGYFCAEAIRRGATYVLGIDANPELIEKAKIRVPSANFYCASWWDIPNIEFDVILFLSAIHYEQDQKALLQKIKHNLTKTGILILECGAVQELGEEWHIIERHDGYVTFPSFGMIMNTLLDGYAVRDLGRSVSQSGDPLPRYVFHCKRLNPTIVFVKGESYSGKSVFTREFAKLGCRVIHLDSFPNYQATFKSDKFLGYLKNVFENCDHDVIKIVNTIVSDGRVDEYTSIISRAIRKEDSLQLIEGFHLNNSEIAKSLESKLRARGFEIRHLDLGNG